MTTHDRIVAALDVLPDHLGACLACGQVAALDPDGICITCYIGGAA